MMKANKQIGFININEESIDKIIKDGEVVFEKGFLREKTSTTLPISFNSIGKDLKDYKIYGNTYQNSTTGKNLRYIEDGTVAGISLTYDNKSGKISIRGTATRTGGIELSKGGEVNIPAGTYTLSVTEPLPVLINSIVSLSSSTNVAFRIPAGNTSVTVNVPSNGVLVGLYFAVTKDVTYDFDCYIQLEEGSVATEFEPFTNGPSPNPDYPQEIVSCGDKTKNMITGLRNSASNYINFYFDKDMAVNNMTVSGIFTYTISNFTIFLQTSFSNDSLLTNQSCTQNEKFSFDIQLTDTQLENIVNSTTTPTIQFYRSGQMSGIGYSEIMLRASDTTPEYEPYGKYKIPVNVRSENLLDIQSVVKGRLDNGIIGYENNTTNLTLNNDSFSFTTNANFRGVTSDYIKINENLIINHENLVTEFGIQCACYDENKTYISNATTRIGSDNHSRTIVVASGTKYIRIYFYLNTLGSITIVKPMLIEGSTAPDKYIPYYNETTNIYLDEPLRKNNDGTYKDYIDFKNGKVVRNVNEIVLNGTENWTLTNSSFQSDECISLYTNKLAPSLRTNQLYSNYFKCVLTQKDFRYNIGKIFTSSANQLYVNMDKSLISSVEDFKTWLSTHNTKVNYVLENQTEESITLPNISTIDGNNTLNIETEITPSQVYIKYKSNI